MKSDICAFAITCAIYTAAVAFFLWGAFFGRVPNDSGIFVLWSALPSSLVMGLIDYEWARDAVASVMHQPVTDRFAIAFDATFAWALGCVQYGVLGILIARSWRSVRPAGA
jgi:predicted permease